VVQLAHETSRALLNVFKLNLSKLITVYQATFIGNCVEGLRDTRFISCYWIRATCSAHPILLNTITLTPVYSRMRGVFEISSRMDLFLIPVEQLQTASVV
jgi:hypothetical protein